MPAPESVKKLIETFGNNIDFYKSAQYNEAQLRQEFLDPFFKELGWDMDNTAGLAPQYRDVIHEASIKIGGSTKAPDYAFSIHGNYKFFLEAKKPAVNVHQDADPAYQLRRYGWSAKLPISILTDFEEFAVYDCRKRPKRGERASTSRLNYFKYTDYIEKWDELCATFSKDAILKGSFDKYTIDSRRHRGTETVDNAFLEEIENWRNLLARNFALRNLELSGRDLNYAVQKTIDRLIFLRICEDRGTEDYKRLATLLNGGRIYPRLLDQFMQADARYNSGLFHFSAEGGRGAPDNITPNLKLDDKVLKEILSKLYYPESPYEFSVLPADILGQVYEQFLGKTIQLTAGHHAKIEEKPEVRKAGGVYYTPSYIVDYIVKNTLGRQLDGADPDKPKPISLTKAAEIKVLDPACGSGSFLIVAYQYLLDWHLRQYTVDPETNEPDEGKIKRHSGGKKPKIYQASGGAWKLATDERKRILLNNIHGVDIDSQAVEVTKLSLLLKVIEGDAQQIKQRDWIRERQRILPDLGNNIKCGNSLIGPDFYDNEQMLLLDQETQYRINVFDWNQGFPETMQRGGFDCVIGNPPYVRSQYLNNFEKDYYTSHYETAQYQPDLFAFFIERGTFLLNPCGKLGFIIPSGLLTNTQYEPLRRYLLHECPPEIIVDLKDSVFLNASVDTIILLLGGSERTKLKNCTFAIGEYPAARLQKVKTPSTNLKTLEVLDSPGCSFNTGASGQTFDFCKQLRESSIPASEFVVVRAGMKVRKELVSTEKKDERFEHFLRGGNVSPYSLNWKKLWVCYDKTLESKFSNQAFRVRSTFEEGNKLIVRQVMGKTRIYATLDRKSFFVDQSLYVLLPKKHQENLVYLLGLLCSKLIGYFFDNTLGDRKRTFPKIKGDQISQLPIRPINFDHPADVAKHDKMVGLVERMLELNEKKADESNPDILQQLETQLAATDRQIDRLVYELYNLTEEEIALVESNG